MHSKARLPGTIFGGGLRTENAGFPILLTPLVLLFLLLFMFVTAQPAQAQTLTVLHNFTAGADGGNSIAGLTMDSAGNFYGTTCGAPCQSSRNNAGTVFRLSKKGSAWFFTTLYEFRGGSDGAAPEARVIIGPDGALYGTTINGGASGCGTVFSLKPALHAPPNATGRWTESVLYSFTCGSDGANPEAEVVFDRPGNLYGTTLYGGHDFGVVFELTPSASGWRETVLHTFTGGDDGGRPAASLVFDSVGNLYGTTSYGGAYSGCQDGSTCGTVFELSPSPSGWNETVLHNFTGEQDGGNPLGGVTFGRDGYLYGTTSWGGANGGTVFSINDPRVGSYYFYGNGDYFPGPWASLTSGGSYSDAEFFGTTYTDGLTGYGSVFDIAVAYACGWTWYTAWERDFTGGSDGAYPLGSVILDANGNVFGTTYQGGAYGYGVVFEITPGSESKSLPQGPSNCREKQ